MIKTEITAFMEMVNKDGIIKCLKGLDCINNYSIKKIAS